MTFTEDELRALLALCKTKRDRCQADLRWFSTAEVTGVTLFTKGYIAHQQTQMALYESLHRKLSGELARLRGQQREEA